MAGTRRDWGRGLGLVWEDAVSFTAPLALGKRGRDEKVQEIRFGVIRQRCPSALLALAGVTGIAKLAGCTGRFFWFHSKKWRAVNSLQGKAPPHPSHKRDLDRVKSRRLTLSTFRPSFVFLFPPTIQCTSSRMSTEAVAPCLDRCASRQDGQGGGARSPTLGASRSTCRGAMCRGEETGISFCYRHWPVDQD